MNKYKINYTLKNKVRVEDKKVGSRNVEAESMEKAIDKFYIFMRAFFGFNVTFTKIEIEEITNN